MLQKIETNQAPAAIGPYSQAVRAGNILYVTGQVPIDPKTGKLVANDLFVQVNQVLDNLEAILKAAGGTMANVVRCDVFLKDFNDFAVVNQEYAKRFNQPITPARQTVQVSKLPLDAMVEISCIAHI